ncbi:NAD(P)-dependent oxidoreductase [Actinomadura craniellae]|uniref:NAD(P)-dependent oxidoreductase n=1 Tax=Actinomadura craniellae TaxID=2231787 RepID=A0A365H6Q7_9ACTN|nr:SDR family oxidoreductase [Actinomadura craniellae]RAY14795.1 NAD(P)-dependent oxidoreductase [Actinomadura craniellae]
MKITILGATGRTGTPLVLQALERDHTVTAVVRDPARLTVDSHPRLGVAVAAALTADSLGPLVAGRDAVLSVLGPHDLGPTSICSDATTAAIAAMRSHGVHRLIVVSASGAYPGPGDPPLVRWVLKPLLGLVLRHPFADTRKMEDALRATDLDWTIVRPPRLTGKPCTGQYRTAVDRNVGGRARVSRADVADCMLNLLENPASARTVVSIG